MIIIINGPLGIGKTTLSSHLLRYFERAVMLDGDWLGEIHPFSLHDPARVDYLYRTLRHVAGFHYAHDYCNLVINYVFEEPDSLAQLHGLLSELDDEIYTFRLVCDDGELERRIRQRATQPELLTWELNRFRELVQIQDRAAASGDLGFVIDTTHLTPEQGAQMIWKKIAREAEPGSSYLPEDPAKNGL